MPPVSERASERSEPPAVDRAPAGLSPDEVHRLAATAAVRNRERIDEGGRESGERSDRIAAKTGRPLHAAARAIAARFAMNDEVDRQPATVARWVGEAAEPGRPAAARGSMGRPALAPLVVPALASPAAAAIAGTMSASAIASRPAMDLDRADLQSQIVQAMRVQWNGTGGDARIRLQPGYLGELTISLKVEHGAVVAHLATSTPDVRQWIESNEATLRQALAQHDLKLERLVVLDEEPTSDSDPEAAPGDREEQQPSRRRRRPAEDATFEVVV